jgi:hypothetical protein
VGDSQDFKLDEIVFLSAGPSLSEAVEEAVWDLKKEAIHSLKNW